MKIVHIIDYFIPKLGYQETYLAKEQIRLGHRVTVVTSDRYFPFPNYQSTVGAILGKRLVGIGVSREQGISVYRLPVLFEVFTRCYLIGLIETLTRLQPDVIHIHSVSSLNAVRIAWVKSRFPKTRIICDDHSHYSVISDHWSKKLFYGCFRLLFGYVLSKRLDGFVAITKETKDIMKHSMGITKNISIIELGADTDVFKFNLSKRQLVRRKYGVGKNDFVILYAGKIIPQKGVDILVQAYLKLPEEGTRLMIIGNGDTNYIETMKWAIRKAHRSDIYWLPMVQPRNLPAYYSAVDVGVWPKQESISMIEASACGLPIVIKKSESMKKRVSDNNGLLYIEGKIADLVDKLTFLKTHRMQAKQMGRRGRNMAERRYSWRIITKQFLDLYRYGTN